MDIIPDTREKAINPGFSLVLFFPSGQPCSLSLFGKKVIFPEFEFWDFQRFSLKRGISMGIEFKMVSRGNFKARKGISRC